MKLTEKQKRFCDYYIETGNGAESARRAGYKGKNHDNIATDNLRKVAVKQYISKKMEQKDKERIASQDEILEYFTSVMRGESMAEVAVVEFIGEGMSKAVRLEKKPDERERLAAAKELAKRYGIDKPKEEVQSEGVAIAWE